MFLKVYGVEGENIYIGTFSIIQSKDGKHAPYFIVRISFSFYIKKDELSEEGFEI